MDCRKFLLHWLAWVEWRGAYVCPPLVMVNALVLLKVWTSYNKQPQFLLDTTLQLLAYPPQISVNVKDLSNKSVGRF